MLHSSTPVPVGGGLTFVSRAAGVGHTCGLTSAGAVYCWGQNILGQPGDGSFTQKLVPTRVAGTKSLVQLRGRRSHT
jgi:alpha-tubulin suppressor-like RCC1 family protein